MKNVFKKTLKSIKELITPEESDDFLMDDEDKSEEIECNENRRNLAATFQTRCEELKNREVECYERTDKMLYLAGEYLGKKTGVPVVESMEIAKIVEKRKPEETYKNHAEKFKRF